jgi:hypothetical protein
VDQAVAIVVTDLDLIADANEVEAVSLRQACVKARSAARSLDGEATHARTISTGPDS